MPKIRSASNIGKAVSLRATGSTYKDIGNTIDCSDHTAAEICKENEQLISNLALQIIKDSTIPIRQNHRDCLLLAHEVYQIALGNRSIAKASPTLALLAMLNLEAKDVLALSHKKECMCLQIMRIAPSHTPGIVINQLFQASRGQSDSEELAVVRALLDSKRDTDVQEGEIVGEETHNDHDIEGAVP